MQTKNQTPIGSNQQSPREKAKGINGGGDRFGFNNQEFEKILSEMTDQQEEEEEEEEQKGDDCGTKEQENIEEK